jgi:TetR/AcrR family transcriptional repressor of bet genes
VPKRVDHEQRRHEITDAVIRIATRGGLPAATFREVAAEAGVSVRLIQYYFGIKDELLLATQRHVAERSTARIREGVAEAGQDPREILRAVLRSFIPTDDDSREATLMFVVLHTASLVDATLARPEAHEVPRALHALVSTHLAAALPRDAARDIEMEAAVLVAMTPSLAQAVLDSTYTPEQALSIVDYAVDRALVRRSQAPVASRT